MILIRAALIHILKMITAGLLTIAIAIFLVLTFAYVTGDRTDREEMHQAAAKIGSYFNLIPDAEASNTGESSN